jgi:hypothetical protein
VQAGPLSALDHGEDEVSEAVLDLLSLAVTPGASLRSEGRVSRDTAFSS